MMRTGFWLALMAALLFPFRFAAALPNNDITRISVSAAGLQADGASEHPSVNSDGKNVAFCSAATMLTSSDDNKKKDIFIKNRTSGLVTKATNGNADSSAPSMSKDVGGRYTVFQSKATDLVNVITSGTQHIYRYDRTIPALILVSQSSAGPGNADSANAAVSSTGQFVAFESKATNLVSPFDSRANADIFLFDSINSGTPITRISNTPGVTEPNGASTSPSISADGRYVAFQSVATDLTATPDLNGSSDIYLYDKNTASIALVSHVVSSSDTGNGDSISAAVNSSGTVVVFESSATNLISTSTVAKKGIYLYDIGTGAITLVDRDLTGVKCNGDSTSPSVSGNGRYVAFVSNCSNMIPVDTNAAADLFVYDRTLNQIIGRKNVTTSLLETGDGAGVSSISDDGSVIAFESASTTLVPSDTNKVADIFAADTSCPTDSDSDGTKDCLDECAFDPAKTLAGVCGCGVADADTDSDGALDCNDQCPTDPSKTSSAACPCGVTDTDANGNGVSDCKDPTADTVPGRPVVSFDNATKRIKVQIPSAYTNVKYKIQLVRGTKVVKNLTCSKRKASFGNLQTGSFTVRYKAGVAPTFSKNATSRTISVKGRGTPTTPSASCG